MPAEEIEGPNTQPLSEVEGLVPPPVGQPDAIELGAGQFFSRLHRSGDWPSMIEFGGVLFNTDRSPEDLETQGEAPS